MRTPLPSPALLPRSCTSARRLLGITTAFLCSLPLGFTSPAFAATVFFTSASGVIDLDGTQLANGQDDTDLTGQPISSVSFASPDSNLNASIAAFARAGVGVLKASSSAVALGAGTGLLRGSSGAVAMWFEDITIEGSSDQTGTGFMRVGLAVGGTLGAAPDQGNLPTFYARAQSSVISRVGLVSTNPNSPGLQTWLEFDLNVREVKTHVAADVQFFSAGSVRRNVNGSAEEIAVTDPGTFYTDIPFAFGSPLRLFADINVGTEGAAFNPGDKATATASFANSAYWGGIVGIYDANGNDLGAFNVKSSSGLDLTRSFVPTAVPLPASIIFLAAGAAALLPRSRRTRC